ncbi:MAG TPA: RluA family pseudouridine synthase [Geobacteraceae bacterium]|nr:RluA family pseudouridine synthase [Geobacteraceae bacterium]
MILAARVGEEQASLRLDDGARELFPQLSKGEIRRIIDLGGCAVNQVMVRVASRQLRSGDEIAIGVMEQERFIDVRYTQDDLLYEDRSYLAINKACGINSQRTPYQFKGTVEYAVGQYLKEQGSSEPARVIHRLDRGTSGVMFFPKTKAAATWISDRLKSGEVEKVYWAIVTDLPEEESWQVDAPIGKLNKFRYGVTIPGRPSLTEFRIIASAGRSALLEALPKTGRTHQIRVHLTHCGLPILGDLPYGGVVAPRMMLHCRRMSFADRGDKTISATAQPDKMFSMACAELGLPLPL